MYVCMIKVDNFIKKTKKDECFNLMLDYEESLVYIFIFYSDIVTLVV